MAKIIAGAFLWISVIAWAFWLGALVYEMNVIIPLWSSNLPESVIEWNSRPNFRMNPTPHYVPLALTTVISSVLALLFGFIAKQRIVGLFVSAACACVTLAFTILYFFAKNDVLFRGENAGLSGPEITNIANAWITGNWVRVSIMAIGFFAAMWAFRSGTDKGTN